MVYRYTPRSNGLSCVFPIELDFEVRPMFGKTHVLGDAGTPPSRGFEGQNCPKDSGTVGKGWRCRWGGEMVDLHGFIYMRNIIMKQRILGYLKFSRDTLRQD